MAINTVFAILFSFWCLCRRLEDFSSNFEISKTKPKMPPLNKGNGSFIQIINQMEKLIVLI